MWLTYIAFTKISIHTSKIIEKIVKKNRLKLRISSKEHASIPVFNFLSLLYQSQKTLSLRGITKGVLKSFDMKGTYKLRNKPRQLLKMHSFKILTIQCSNALQQEQSWATASTSKERHHSICNVTFHKFKFPHNESLMHL